MSSTNIVSMADLRKQLAEKLQSQKSTLPPPSSSRIKLVRVPTMAFEMPNGDTLESLTGVIVDYRYVNTFYAKRYNPNTVESPTCWSVNADYTTMVPDDSSTKKEGDACETCPKNQWGSDPGGGKGKACKNQIRIALVTPDSDAKSPVFTLMLPPTSAGPFVKLLRRLRDPIQTQLVSLSLSTKVDYPLVEIATIGDAPDALAPMMMSMMAAAKDRLDLGFDYE